MIETVFQIFLNRIIRKESKSRLVDISAANFLVEGCKKFINGSGTIKSNNLKKKKIYI